MGNQPSRPSPEQDVSKNEPKQPSSTSSVAGSAGTAAATPALSSEAESPTPSAQTFNPLNRVVFVNQVMLFAAQNVRHAFELRAVNATWTDTINNFTVKHNPRFGFTTEKLLKAVAMGRESREVNLDRQPEEIFAADILRSYPEYLLKRAHLTDWAGRTFKGRITKEHPEGEGITAFEYGLWAKDFKMLEMMLNCIPVGEEGAAIRMELLRQYEQVTIPRYQGGGLTYMHTYERPKVDAAGIPIKDASGNWDCETVTEERWGNHFDITPLLNAYKDYDTHFADRTWPQREACWIKVIGTLQHLLPIHILQRYCDPDIPFYPLPSFTGNFKRTAQFYNYLHSGLESLLSSSLAADFSLFRGGGPDGASRGRWGTWVAPRGAVPDLAAVRQINEVSTNEIEKIKRLLTAPGESPTQFRR